PPLNFQSRTDGIFIGPPLSSKGFADNCGSRRGFVIAGIKTTATQKTDLHGREVIRRYDVYVAIRFLVGWRSGPAFDRERSMCADSAEWNSIDDRRGSRTRNRLAAINHLLKKSRTPVR